MDISRPAASARVVDQTHSVFDHVLQRQRLEPQVHLAGLDLRHVEDVVDQRQQVLARRQNVLGIASVAGIAQGAEHLADHDLREAVDGVQRRAQLVAHIGQEFALGLVGALGAHLLGLVLARKFGELLLPASACLFLAFHGGDVGGREHHAAFGRRPL
jgi:hypothetical protein